MSKPPPTLSDKAPPSSRIPTIPQTLAILLGLLLSITFCSTQHAQAQCYRSKRGWILTPKQAAQLHKKGAIFLDTRRHTKWKQSHIKGSQHINWSHFSPKRTINKGKLLPISILRRKLRAMGLSPKTPVVVVGDPLGGWGEEGRIVWMLRTLGHSRAAFVDGGAKALRKTSITWTQQPNATKPSSSWNVRMNRRWTIQRSRLRKQLKNPHNRTLRLVDTRERREFFGATPYGEKRGGTLPGALHLHYKTLLNRAGRLHSRARLLRILKKQGITQKHRVIAYCTGGVRSAWFVAVLVDLGFRHVQNYAGSMWEWSSQPQATHPLVRPKSSPAPTLHASPKKSSPSHR